MEHQILKDKNILVINSNDEIGIPIAEEILNLGGNLTVFNSKTLTENNYYTDKKNITKLPIDLFNINELNSNINSIITELSSLNGLVFNSGIGGVRPLSMTDNKIMLDMFNANCASFVEIIRLLNKKNKIENGSSIVAISSISSIKGLKSKIAYSASKAALDASVRGIAAELSKKKIRVNSILKGTISTDFKLKHIIPIIELNKEKTHTNQLLEITEPTEIANLVTFLLSDRVTTMTGVSITLDGGYSL